MYIYTINYYICFYSIFRLSIGIDNWLSIAIWLLTTGCPLPNKNHCSNDKGNLLEKTKEHTNRIPVIIFRPRCLGCVSQFFVRASIGTKLTSKRPPPPLAPVPDTRNETYFCSLSTSPNQACLILEMSHIYRVGILLPAGASSTIN